MNARLPDAALHGLDALRSDGFAILDGEIVHRRARPARHAFAYRGFCLRLPLSRLHELPSRGVARNAAGLIAFHEADHGDGGSPLAWIRAICAREGVAADGEVVLYAFPRMLGYLFAPVSFWAVHDRHGDLRAVLAEVRNTFGERHDYLVAPPDGRPIAAGETLVARKVFHVSPFCEPKGRYAFRFRFGAERWLARVDYHDDDAHPAPLLETWISGVARPLDRGAVRALPWRYGWFTLAVVARIHWHAARLALKRVPIFRKPAPPRERLSR
jgi:DUF1365 family protein